MSTKSLKDFLGTLVDAALDEPPRKKGKHSSTSKSTSEASFGYTEISKLEHSGRMLQKNIKQILEVAPTIAELDSLARGANSDDFTQGQLKSNKLVLMAAALKSKYNSQNLPIFDQILKEEIDVLKKENSMVSEAELPKEAPPVEESTTDSGKLVPLPEIRSPTLKARVFQHKSMSANKTYLDDKEIIGRHNERLEFLGDSVLNTIVTRILYERFPYAKEGQLSRMRSTLVSNKTLAEFSQAYDFHRKLRCIIDEDQLRIGSQKVYADIFEAYIGALSMERGYDLSEVEAWLASLMNKMINKMGKELEQELPVDRNAKAELYALIGSASSHPRYVAAGNNDNSNAAFKVHCMMDDEVIGEGEAPNFRDAGLRAAKAALGNKQVIEKFSRKRAESERSTTAVRFENRSFDSSGFPLIATAETQPNKFAKNELYAYFGKQVGLVPSYDITKDEDGYKAQLMVKEHVLSVASDVSKKNAQSRAATVVLQNKDKLDEFIRWVS